MKKSGEMTCPICGEHCGTWWGRVEHLVAVHRWAWPNKAKRKKKADE